MPKAFTTCYSWICGWMAYCVAQISTSYARLPNKQNSGSKGFGRTVCATMTGIAGKLLVAVARPPGSKWAAHMV